MHCNDLKCGDIAYFCYITKSFCFMKVKCFSFFNFFFWGGGGCLFLASCSEDQSVGCDEVKWT